eukprot:3705544-Rhodomonas_salina.1
MLTAVMFTEGNIWRYSEVFFMGVLAFMTFALASPLVSLVRISSLHAKVRQEKTTYLAGGIVKQDGIVVTDHVLSGWLFICFFYLCAMLVALVGMMTYVMQVPVLIDYTSTLIMLVVIVLFVFLVSMFSTLTLSSWNCTAMFNMQNMWVLSEVSTTIISLAGLMILWV